MTHYMRWSRFGDPLNHGSQIRGDDVARFWSYVEKTDDCWAWTGGKGPGGYGAFRFKGKQLRAHRYAYELEHGQVPDGLVLDHLCRNRSCVRPDHLEPVTQRENILRGEGAAADNARKTHCNRGHEFTELNTYVNKNGGRVCRTCVRENMRRYRAEKRSAEAA